MGRRLGRWRGDLGRGPARADPVGPGLMRSGKDGPCAERVGIGVGEVQGLARGRMTLWRCTRLSAPLPLSYDSSRVPRREAEPSARRE